MGVFRVEVSGWGCKEWRCEGGGIQDGDVTTGCVREEVFRVGVFRVEVSGWGCKGGGGVREEVFKGGNVKRGGGGG